VTEDEREAQLVELVKLDYEAALRSMGGFIATGGQMRGVGIAAWSVIFGLAVRDSSPALAALAAVVVAVFWYADAYHAALYRRALSRALELEGLLAAYIDRLGIDADDPMATNTMIARLESHRFGMHRTLRPVTGRDLLRTRPVVVFRVIYPSLLIAAIAATITTSL
jgi:hypothetical protein